MSLNASSEYNINVLLKQCSHSKGPPLFILMAVTGSNLVLSVPLCLLVILLGFQRWRQRNGGRGSVSHSDFLTFNAAAMTLLEVLGSVLFCFGSQFSLFPMMSFGYDLVCIAWVVKEQFHSFTCVERYLAVLHPLTYVSLKSQSGVRIRNVSVCGVWLLFAAWLAFSSGTISNISLITYFFVLAVALVAVCFCSVAVLRGLRGAGPVASCALRERVDRRRRKAFTTIFSILGTLLISMGGVMVCDALFVSNLLSNDDACFLVMSTFWFLLPGNAMLPLFYLHRIGKLSVCARSGGSA